MVAGGALERLPTAAGALGGQAPGLLSTERYCDSSARLVLGQVERLAGALAASARDTGANAQVLGSWHGCVAWVGASGAIASAMTQMQFCRVFHLHQLPCVPAPRHAVNHKLKECGRALERRACASMVSAWQKNAPFPAVSWGKFAASFIKLAWHHITQHATSVLQTTERNTCDSQAAGVRSRVLSPFKTCTAASSCSTALF